MATYKILTADGSVINTINAEVEFMAQQYPNGNYELLPDAIAPAPLAPPMSVLAFRNRFTTAEKIAIYTAAAASIAVQVWLDDLAAASTVDVSHEQTIAGVNALAAAGVITAARAAEILA